MKKPFPVLIAALLASSLTALGADRPGLLIPAYFTPGDDSPWSELNDAAKSGVPLIAVMNPDVGPGAKADPAYTRAITDLQKAGGRVVGYVFTKVGLRNPVHVLEDITRYHQFYPELDGIFIDQMPTAEKFRELDNRKPSPLLAEFAKLGGPKLGRPGEGESARKTMLEYYYRVWLHAKALKSEWLVIGNPGGHPDKEFFEGKAADLFVTYSGWEGYDSHQTPDWLKNNRDKQTAHLIYDTAFPAEMKKRVAAAKSHGASWIYVTDDGGGNPWDTLPAYWDEELAELGGSNASAKPEKKRGGFFRRKK